MASIPRLVVSGSCHQLDAMIHLAMSSDEFGVPASGITFRCYLSLVLILTSLLDSTLQNVSLRLDLS
jgi:hypothetical protein